ncbi:MAG: carbohydrate kinase [Fibromonadales bacterium]|nr:carbohydrate kinase [Fibromonadales bacterium]
MTSIIGLGEILWDIFPGQKKVLGGAPANFAWHASQFGFNSCVMSAVGNDKLGLELLDVLTKKGLNFLIETVEQPTGTVQVTLDGKGIPQYEICENVAWDNIPFTGYAEELAKNCKALYFGTLAQRNEVSRTTTRRLLELVPKDAYRVFDINLRQHFYSKEIVHESLQRCNVLKINDEEIAEISRLFEFGAMSEVEICRYLLNVYNLDIIMETKGAIGSYVFTQDETSYLNTPKVQVVSTVGAGDAFTGSFIATMLQGHNLQKAHQKAVEVSAYVCTQHGGMP